MAKQPPANKTERPAASAVERPAASAVERPAVSAVERPAVSAVERPVESLAGITSSRAKHLAAMGVATLGDLLEYLPRDYRFEAREGAIPALRDGIVGLARGEVIAVNYITGRGRPRYDVTIDDGQGQLTLVFFNGGYLRRRLVPGLISRCV